ncbi:MAG: hypothetical protein U0228_23240 [Myxococcaceae bacterium]
MKTPFLLLLCATVASAQTVQRRLDVEAALVKHDAARSGANVAIGLSGLTLIASTVLAGSAISLQVQDAASATTAAVTAPVFFALGSRAPVVPNHAGEITALWTSVLVTAVAGVTGMLASLVWRECVAPPRARIALLEEREKLLRVERRDELVRLRELREGLSDVPPVGAPEPLPPVAPLHQRGPLLIPQ